MFWTSHSPSNEWIFAIFAIDSWFQPCPFSHDFQGFCCWARIHLDGTQNGRWVAAACARLHSLLVCEGKVWIRERGGLHRAPTHETSSVHCCCLKLLTFQPFGPYTSCFFMWGASIHLTSALGAGRWEIQSVFYINLFVEDTAIWLDKTESTVDLKM